MSEIPQPEAMISRRDFLIAVGLATGVGAAGLSGCSEAPPEEEFPPRPDCRETPYSIDSQEVGPEGVELNALSWEMPGVEKQGNKLRVTPVSTAVYNEHTKTYERIQPYNTNHRIDGDQQFRLEASFSTANRFTIALSEGLPLIHDTFTIPAAGSQLTFGNGELLLESWNGRQQKAVESFKVKIPTTAEQTIAIDRIGDMTSITIDGEAVYFWPLMGKNLWLGVSAYDGPADVVQLKLSAPDGGMSVSDMNTLQFAACDDGLAGAARKKRKDLHVGTAVALTPLLCDPEYAAILGGNFNSITTENALKPQFSQPEEGVFTLDKARQIAAFAKRHGKKVHGHTLMPNRSFPKWMADLPTDTPAQKRRVEAVMINHIKTLVSSLPEITSWDLFNEPLDHEGWADTPFFRAMGERMLEVGLRAALEASPKGEFWLNNYAMDKGIGDEKRFLDHLNIMEALAKKGLRFAGLGFEGHNYTVPNDNLNPDELRRRIRMLAARGFKARVSEMDVNPNGGDEDQKVTKDGLRIQARQMRDTLKVCAEEPNCDFSLWGIGGKYVSTARIENGALSWNSHLPWDNYLRPYPAYSALHQALR